MNKGKSIHARNFYTILYAAGFIPVSHYEMFLQMPAQRFALPAGGRDETTPLCRNQLQAPQSA
jgi:hypothetical protein